MFEEWSVTFTFHTAAYWFSSIFVVVGIWYVKEEKNQILFGCNVYQLTAIHFLLKAVFFLCALAILSRGKINVICFRWIWTERHSEICYVSSGALELCLKRLWDSSRRPILHQLLFHSRNTYQWAFCERKFCAILKQKPINNLSYGLTQSMLFQRVHFRPINFR